MGLGRFDAGSLYRPGETLKAADSMSVVTGSSAVERRGTRDDP
jgi:hypothetical protein